MDAIFRRSYSRIPGITLLFALAVFSILFISSSESGVDAPSQHYRRDVGGLVWRQEPSGNASSTAPTGTSPFGTSNSTTISSTTETSTSTSSVSTTTTISTSSSTRSVTSTTTTITSTSTTSISTSESSSSTSSSVVPVATSTVTRTRARATTTSEPVPETTLFAGADFLPTFTTTQTSTQGESPTGTPLAVGATSKGFWANKAAVAAVFVIVSLVILGVAALLIVSFLKRRNTARQRLLHTRLFEKYSDSPSPKGSLRRAPDVVYDDSRFTGAKVTSEYPFAGTASNAVASSSALAAATAPAPQQQQQQYQYQAPPSSSHGSHQTAFYTPNPSQQSLSTHEQHNAAAFSAFSTNPAPLTAVATTQRTHYMLPSQSQAAAVSHYTTTSRSAPPVAYRDPTQADRTSYQHSIDSFYGGGNQR